MIDRAQLQQIWEYHGLGTIEQIIEPLQGAINAVYIIDMRYVMRVDGLQGKHPYRFASEHIAYTRLAETSLPVPAVVAYDDSHMLIPHTYLIVSYCQGVPLDHCWLDLDSPIQYHIAAQMGHYLATIHDLTFPQFGKLSHVMAGQGFTTWLEYLRDYYHRYMTPLRDASTLATQPLQTIDQIFQHLEPDFAQVTTPCLVHSDYHLGNILVADGVISGILDFEWALAGDPRFDFSVADKWQTLQPTLPILYQAYAENHPFDERDFTIMAFYKLLLYIEDCASQPQPSTIDAIHQLATDLLKRC